LLVLELEIEKVLVQHRVLARDAGKEVVHELFVEDLLLGHIGDCQRLVAPHLLVLVSFDDDALGLY